MDGVARCTRYAFGPNRLHMCGPDMNQEVLAYINEGATDQGLSNILKNFHTLYPYLTEIAHANNIKDPFNPRVVEAYWIGNDLLEGVSKQTFFIHLTDNLELKKKISEKSLSYLTHKIKGGARMHHSFHVFNVWRRTGHLDEMHTLESMDQCRVSSGKVLAVNGPVITVLRKPIVMENKKLILGDEKKENVIRELQDNSIIDDVKRGDTISMHWGVPCEVLTDEQHNNLIKYTTLSLTLANQTI
jgi:hypothetical protein